MTVAMHLAKRGRRIPKEWCHDKNIKDKNGLNVHSTYMRHGHKPM